jgi:ATP-dependent exoDNAse (exonuclease V) beta subunit
VAPSSLRTGGRVDVIDLLELDPTGPHLRGSMIHAWLELIEWLDGDSPPPDDAALIAAARRVAPGVGDDWLADQISGFRETLGHTTVCRALARPAATHDLWRERRFAVELEDNLVEGAFDRVTVFREQAAIVGAELIDFKTNRIEPRQVDELIETYRGQIETYRDALAKMLHLDRQAVRAALLLWELPRLVEL